MSNLKLDHTPRTFAEAEAILGKREAVRIGYMTHLKRGSDGEIYATHHHNEIVEYRPSGVHASWAGWASSTTRDRLNKLTYARFNIKDRAPHVNGERVSSTDWVKVS